MLLGLVSDITPGFIAHPVSRFCMRIMYSICFEGPGGFDDGIQAYIVRNGKRYRKPAKAMLSKASPNSRDQQVAQYFLELSE
jgi:hypothetical protein